YLIYKTSYEIYTDMGHTEKAGLQIKDMLNYAAKSGNKDYATEALVLAAQYYFLTNQTKKGDECISKLVRYYDSGKDFEATDSAFHIVIDRGVDVNSAGMVKRAFEKYNVWSDSVDAATADSQLAKVRRDLDQSNQTIAERDSTITAKNAIMITMGVLLLCAIAAVVVCLLLYLRILRRNRRLNQSVKAANDQSAAKSAILHNMSAKMAPTLNSLDSSNPSVKNLLSYVNRVGELSDVGDTAPRDADLLEDVSLQPFCEQIAERIRPMLKKDVKLSVDVPRVSAKIDATEVEKILEYLLTKAAKYTPEGGKIFLSYKKRGIHVHQFVVSDNGPGIPAELRETIFTPFSTASDNTEGTGLGLPICALRAEKLGGTLELDTDHSRGATFVLTLR
ncbi:MAG: HAMP domain-containing histidine kinase, partial [Muribaculaceae bacterium]|nr:HAMP domain-containing histidine kinase [Muribaculaceae bacterium]